VDCILLKEGSAIVPVESKYRGNIRKRELKGLIKFLREFSLEEGYVVTRDTDAIETVDGMRVIFVPLWRWLLQEGSDLRHQGTGQIKTHYI